MNCNCKSCKNWKQYGGKLLGQGEYGCVYDSVFQCKNTANQIINKLENYFLEKIEEIRKPRNPLDFYNK